MILFEICDNDEGHPAYREMMISNLNRQYSFLLAAIQIASKIGQPYLSHTLVKSLNHHAITCLHNGAGEYRECGVVVGQGPEQFNPPDHTAVPGLMDDFVNEVNKAFGTVDPLELAAFALWRLNVIHPFVNGNGRTARAICYYIICMYAGGPLAGLTIVPELIRQNRPEYVLALKHADKSVQTGPVDLGPLHALLSQLLTQQLQSSAIAAPADQQPA